MKINRAVIAAVVTLAAGVLPLSAPANAAVVIGLQENGGAILPTQVFSTA